MPRERTALQLIEDAWMRLCYGPYWTATVRLEWDDLYGQDAVTTALYPFRARSRIGAATEALRLAQKDVKTGWVAARITDVIYVGEVT